jgi:hypothetical protein
MPSCWLHVLQARPAAADAVVLLLRPLLADPGLTIELQQALARLGIGHSNCCLLQAQTSRRVSERWWRRALCEKSGPWLRELTLRPKVWTDCSSNKQQRSAWAGKVATISTAAESRAAHLKSGRHVGWLYFSDLKASKRESRASHTPKSRCVHQLG